jgi:outer membrane protein assembly factor BamD
MKHRLPSLLLLSVVSSAGCSSISMPSMPSLPSMPWSGSSAKADPSEQALVDEGNRAFDDKKYVRAIDRFSKLRTDYPFSPLITQAELKIADAYYLNQQYPEAINGFKEFQSMHPTNENMPFVTLRLGQAHFDQFTSADRDQKNTEIAKGYFENVITNYPKSPQAAEAKEKLAKTLDILAEHEFTIAQFYFQQQRFPAARDRFEEIIRKYKDTPTAVKSLFYLGESYRSEKNGLKARLAYEALIQHYPQSKFASEAKVQMAAVEKEQRDPLDLVLMRDRRPGALATPEIKEDPALAKLKDLNLVAKKEVVYEEPGEDKGFLRRVADKINPFSSSGSDKKEEKPAETATELLARKAQAQKQDNGGILASLWPFGSKDNKDISPSSNAKTSAVVSKVDETLKQKGIDIAAKQAAVKTPEANLPKADTPTEPAVDTLALLGSIDANLKKTGKNGTELPPPPEAAAGFRDTAATQAIIAKAEAEQRRGTPQKDVQESGILSSIDQKLKAQGVEPAKFDKPPSAEEIKAVSAQKPQNKNVELEPKFTMEKGPLFLNPGETISHDKSNAEPEVKKNENKPAGENANELPDRVLVKGPVQPQNVVSAARAAETKKPTAQDDEPKGALESIRDNIDSIGKALNPFRW